MHLSSKSHTHKKFFTHIHTLHTYISNQLIKYGSGQHASIFGQSNSSELPCIIKLYGVAWPVLTWYSGSSNGYNIIEYYYSEIISIFWRVIFQNKHNSINSRAGYKIIIQNIIDQIMPYLKSASLQFTILMNVTLKIQAHNIECSRLNAEQNIFNLNSWLVDVLILGRLLAHYVQFPLL